MHAYYVFSWIMKFFTHGVGVEAFKLDWEGGGWQIWHYSEHGFSKWSFKLLGQLPVVGKHQIIKAGVHGTVRGVDS